MAEPRTKENRELSLGDDFGPAVVRFNGLTVTTDGNGNVKLENGRVTVDIADGNTSVFGGNVIAHTDGTVQLIAPAPEQTNAPGVIASRVEVKGSSIIRAGTVQLNKISQYLAGLPDTAKAELLVSPQDLANIDGGGLGTWVDSITRIRDIKGYHGLDGMRVFDRPETAPHISLEEDIANHIKLLLAFAQSSGKEVTTGLFMPTKQLVHGREIGSGKVTVDTNLYSKRKKIGKQGDEFITKRGSVDAHWQLSATENPDGSSYVYVVDFTDGVVDVWDHKGRIRLSSRPVALRFNRKVVSHFSHLVI